MLQTALLLGILTAFGTSADEEIIPHAEVSVGATDTEPADEDSAAHDRWKRRWRRRRQRAQPAPEPATLSLLAIGGLGLARARRRRKKRESNPSA